MCWLLLFLLGNQCTTVFIISKIVLLRGIESFFDMLLFNVTFEILAHKTLFTSTLNCNCNFCKTAWLSGSKNLIILTDIWKLETWLCYMGWVVSSYSDTTPWIPIISIHCNMDSEGSMWNSLNLLSAICFLLEFNTIIGFWRSYYGIYNVMFVLM